MSLLVLLGSATTLVGLAGLIWCIRKAAALRRQTDRDQVRQGLHGLVALNMASVAVAGLGLALVVVGLIIG